MYLGNEKWRSLLEVEELDDDRVVVTWSNTYPKVLDHSPDQSRSTHPIVAFKASPEPQNFEQWRRNGVLSALRASSDPSTLRQPLLQHLL
jgi:hypothetical protein